MYVCVGQEQEKKKKDQKSQYLQSTLRRQQTTMQKDRNNQTRKWCWALKTQNLKIIAKMAEKQYGPQGSTWDLEKGHLSPRALHLCLPSLQAQVILWDLEKISWVLYPQVYVECIPALPVLIPQDLHKTRRDEYYPKHKHQQRDTLLREAKWQGK